MFGTHLPDGIIFQSDRVLTSSIIFSRLLRKCHCHFWFWQRVYFFPFNQMFLVTDNSVYNVPRMCIPVFMEVTRHFTFSIVIVLQVPQSLCPIY